MKAQTKLASLKESGVNILVGFTIQWIANYFVLPWFHLHPSVSDLFGIGAIFTVISVARSYGLRRVFEAKRAADVPPDFQHIIEELAAERHRQIGGEGYSLAHDDDHVSGEIGRAGAAYAMAGSFRRCQDRDLIMPHIVTAMWPWSPNAFKPTQPRRDLIKAGALIIAEIGRIDRARARVR